MRCPRCQQGNPLPDAQFCPRCGAPVKRFEESGPLAASYADLLSDLAEVVEPQRGRRSLAGGHAGKGSATFALTTKGAQVSAASRVRQQAIAPAFIPRVSVDMREEHSARMTVQRRDETDSWVKSG